MCFSPAASFGASVVLAATGIVAVSRARTKPQRMLAGIPVVFAIQQFTEGILWLSLQRPEWSEWQRSATYAFLIFAQVIWPIYIPLAAGLFEQHPIRKKVIHLITAAGFVFAAYILYCLYRYPAAAFVEQHHIRYELGFALSKKWYYGLLYFVPTIVAPFVSSKKVLHWLAYLFLGSYIVTRLVFHFYVISIWCFLGAIISLIVLVMIRRLNRAEAEG